MRNLFVMFVTAVCFLFLLQLYLSACCSPCLKFDWGTQWTEVCVHFKTSRNPSKKNWMRVVYIFSFLLFGYSVRHGLSYLKNDITQVFSPMACIISCIIVPTQLQPSPIEMVCFPGSAYLFPILDEHLNMRRESHMMQRKNRTCDFF